jgi:hypothetical protein
MKASYFQDAVESSTKVIGRKDVQVVFEGDRAETNGDIVYLPALPPSSEITIDQAEVVRGFRDHETMHVRCTDTSKATMQKLSDVEKSNKSLARLVQYCEDIRIEHAGIQEYAGMKTSLSAIQTHAAKMLVEQLEGMGKPEEVITKVPRNIQLRVLLQSMGRNKIGVESGGVFEKLCESIKQADPKLHQFADEWATKMSQLPTGFNGKELIGSTAKKGTAESFAMAEAIYKAFGELDDTPPPPPPPPEGEGEGDGEPDDCEGDGEGEGKGQGEGKGKGKPEDSDDEDDSGGGGGGEDDEEDKDEDEEKDGKPSGSEDEDDSDSEDDDDQGSGGSGGGDSDDEDDGDDGSGGRGGNGDGKDDEIQQSGAGGGSGNNTATLPEDAVNVDDLYKDALKDVVQDVHDHGPDLKMGGQRKKRFKVYSRRFSQLLKPIDAAIAVHGGKTNNPNQQRDHRQHGLDMMTRMDKELTGKKAMIRRLLEVELQARSDRRWESGFKSGRLQSVRLVQAIQGRETVYQRRDGGKDMDTLLYVSIDGSGSMDGSRMWDSVKLAYALSEALERTGCDIIVTSWGNTVVCKDRYPQSSYSEDDFDKMRDRFSKDRNSTGAYPDVVCLGVLNRSLIKAKRQRTTDNETRAGFGVATLGMNSSTPSYHAVFEDLHDMGKESHSKKIYLHITDGQPDAAQNGASTVELMKEAHEYAASLKIHMIGVGIAGMQVGHMFPDNIMVTGSDAYEPVIKKLAKLVAQEAGHAPSFKRAA